ncbi:hypothetical protein CROQUDRAFT_97276 [Cronartium quercuum f. sp. fusiforme G11]|uniref:Uncharacterized protein n=1 Tax=Cronartium quercuum f. sp. fusiforme G11 TaxID=708437 RepID=A0A9P6NEN5_9BASI|nr:hypothetical protein CROQUDRAFT_97276 [Cronartium quercuum f. sp. fusiforme G11]
MCIQPKLSPAQHGLIPIREFNKQWDIYLRSAAGRESLDLNKKPPIRGSPNNPQNLEKLNLEGGVAFRRETVSVRKPGQKDDDVESLPARERTPWERFQVKFASEKYCGQDLRWVDVHKNQALPAQPSLTQPLQRQMRAPLA